MSEYADYYVIRARDMETIREQVGDEPYSLRRSGERWVLVFTEESIEELVELALHFDDQEGRSWSFAFFHRGEEVYAGQFGESIEDGIARHGNFLRGDGHRAAMLWACDPRRLELALSGDAKESPRAFAELLGFDHIPATIDSYADLFGEDAETLVTGSAG